LNVSIFIQLGKPDSCGRRRYYSPWSTSESQMP